MNVRTGGRDLLVSVLIVFGLVFGGCSSKKATKDFDGKPASAANVKKGVKPQPDSEVAVIETADFGTIVIELYPNIAPKMVAQFKKLVQDKFYDGTTFHRINPEAQLIQGGDPLSKDSNPDNDGTGDSSLPNVPGEFSDIPFERGTVGAARKGASQSFAGETGLSEEQARDTGNCQFFITLEATPQFDEDYTVFGKVISGINTADVIMRAPQDPSREERPADPIVIKSITLQPRSKYVSS